MGKQLTTYHYLRYSWDGVFRRTGFYFDKDIDPARWQQIKTQFTNRCKTQKKMVMEVQSFTT